MKQTKNKKTKRLDKKIEKKLKGIGNYKYTNIIISLKQIISW